VYAPALEALGIPDYEALITCDADAIVAGMRERGFFLSIAEVERWCHHAESYRDARPILFGPPLRVGEAFIALDLEYNTFNPHIWLIGLHLIDGDRREHVALWADGPRHERRNLLELAQRVALHPELTVLTWSGHSADIPTLHDAARRCRLGDVFAPLFDRHVDLYLHATKTLRLPTPNFSLGEIASYLGIPKLSDIGGGLEAQMRYDQYLAIRDPKRKPALKADLIAYNRDDLEGLVGVLQAIQALGAADAMLTP
jgi:predicted RecB family nuclease